MRVFDVPEPAGTASTLLVYLPRQRFHARLPEQVAELVGEVYGSEPREIDSFLGSSNLARITFTVDRGEGEPPDLDVLSEPRRRADDLVDRPRRSTPPSASSARPARQRLLERGRRCCSRVVSHERRPRRSRSAISNTSPNCSTATRVATKTAFVHQIDDVDAEWRMRVYRKGTPIALAELLPMLGHVGLQALDEHPVPVRDRRRRVLPLRHRCACAGGRGVDGRRHAEVRRTFEELLAGEVESDGFNRLVLVAGVDGGAGQRAALLRQVRPSDRVHVQPGLHPGDAGPAAACCRDCWSSCSRPGSTPMSTRATGSRRSPSPSRICSRRSMPCRHSTTTASAACSSPSSAPPCAPAPSRASRRWRSSSTRSQIPDMPAPRPAHEIFVCSSRVEGVHLRGGRDRQRRSAVERPSRGLSHRGARSGEGPDGEERGDRAGRAPREGSSSSGRSRRRRSSATKASSATACSCAGCSTSPTTSSARPSCRHRARIRYDDDDPYLVVAADKGTATFSDTANAVAAEYDFWLGDAFASGGSAGYDHKAMAITARGAWESVRSHARVLGMDADLDELTVVGVGDMSGDVFGNGMLRSSHLKLVAAFDHRHVFVDPNPDPAISFAERKRLFDTPRSSWADYDPTLISEGGGVFPRTAKSIDITPQMREALAITAERLTPTELIKAVLKAPVDLLWNGGIGTYVKAASEINSQVGDRANDAVRVDGGALRCRDGRRGRQPRVHPARPRRVRPQQRADLHRRDRQLGGCRLQRPRGQHQDPAGRCDRRGRDDGQAAQPTARRDDRRGRRAGARTTTAPRRWR